MFKRKSVGRIISALITAAMLLTMGATLCSAEGADVVALLDSELAALKTSATDEQNAALAEVEDAYNEIKVLDASDSPWNAVVTGAAGVPALLTDEVKGNIGLNRYIKLSHLASQDISISWSGEPVVATEILLDSFKEKLEIISADYDVSDDSAQGASIKFPELVTALNDADALLTSIKNNLEQQGGEFIFSEGELTEAEVLDGITERIVKLLKDFNAVVFATADSYENAYDDLLSSDNKKIIAAMFGSDFASALASDEVNNRIVEYFKYEQTLEKIVERQVALFNADAEEAVNELYDLFADLANGLLEEDVMTGIKNGFEYAGWTVDSFLAANKYIADEADPECKSRIITLNMLIGRFMGIYKDDVLCSEPIEIDCDTAEELEFDIAVAVESYKASIINVINSFVYNAEGEKSETILSEDDHAALKFIVESPDEGDFVLRVYRSGGTNNVYGYLREFELDVTSDEIPVKGISLNVGKTVSLKEDQTKQLVATVTPENATNKNVIWKSSNEKVAKVSDKGLVTAVSKGSAVITATTKDGGFVASVTVNVSATVKYTGGGTSSNTGTGNTPSADIIMTDTSEHWAKSDIEDLVATGIISGYQNADGTYYFAPDKEITRAEFATMVARALGLDENSNIVFSDTENHWAKGYISAMAERGYMIGYGDGTFKPDIPIPREQIIAVSVRSACLSGEIINTAVVTTDDEFIVSKILLDNPDIDISGTQITAPDFDSASEWAKDYVRIAAITNIVTGYEDGTIRPTSNATRAEAAVLIKRILVQ